MELLRQLVDGCAYSASVGGVMRRSAATGTAVCDDALLGKVLECGQDQLAPEVEAVGDFGPGATGVFGEVEQDSDSHSTCAEHLNDGFHGRGQFGQGVAGHPSILACSSVWSYPNRNGTFNVSKGLVETHSQKRC